MKIYKSKIKDTNYHKLTDFTPLMDKTSIYIDIETTGFNRKHNMIYLIGLLYYESHDLVLVQYLCQKPADEYELLYKFNNLITNFDEIIHFNGDRFDIPFIKERMNLYRIKENLSLLSSLDFYKLLQPLKKVLATDNLKLKTMEKLAGYHRSDPFSGGELIQLYDQYTKGDQALESSFIMHNEEDMIGLFYLNTFRPLISLMNLKLAKEDLTYYLDTNNNTYTINVALELPRHYFTIDINREDYRLHLDDQLHIVLPVKTKELKIFFDDYKNYYYLTEEDYAIHESLASFVQAKFKKRASKNTAYTKHKSTFIQCPITKSQIMSLTPSKERVFIFNETITDTHVFLRISDCDKLLPPILPQLLKNLMT